MQRNLGRKTLSEISSSEEWKCLVCDPKQIYEQRALFYAIFQHQQELKPKRRDQSAGKGVKRKSAVQIVKLEPQQLIHFSADNFVEENFAEAVKTLEAYQVRAANILSSAFHQIETKYRNQLNTRQLSVHNSEAIQISDPQWLGFRDIAQNQG